MAENESTTKFKVDMTELKKGIQEAQRQIRLANSEFKAAASGMDDWGHSADGLSAKIKQLKTTLNAQQTILRNLETQYAAVVEEQGEGSRAAQELAIRINNQRTAVNNTSRSLSQYEDALNDIETGNEDVDESSDDAAKGIKDVGDASKKSEKEAGGLASKLGSLAKKGLVGIATAAAGAAAAFLASGEASQEYMEDMGKLETAFTSAGHSVDTAKESYQGMVGILGETDQSVEAVNHLAKLTQNQEELAKWTDIAAGVYGTFGDSLPIEGLTEAANETAKVGQVTGPLADALNWAGISEDEFNEKLAACADEQERSTLITQTLSETYQDAADKYKEVNGDLIAARQATSDMNAAMAEMGRVAMPVTTALKQGFADLLTSMLPGLQQVGEGLKGMMAGTEGAGEQLQSGMQSVFDGLLGKVTEMLPNVLNIGISLITSLAQGVIQALPSVADAIIQAIPQLMGAATQIVMSLVEGITQAIPNLIPAISRGLYFIIDAIINAVPQLLQAGITLFNTLITAFVDFLPNLLDLINELVVDLVYGLLDAMPQLLQGAITFFTAIVQAIPTIITLLLGELPVLIEYIIDFIIQAVPQLISAAITLLMAIVDAIPTIITALTEALPTIIAAIITGITNALPQLLQAAITLLMAIIDAIPLIIEPLAEAIPTIITTIMDALIENIPVILECAITLFMALVEAIPTIIKALTKALPKIITSIMTALGKLLPKLATFGLEVLGKILQFFGDLILKAGEKAGEFITKIMDTIKDLPSKVWDKFVEVIGKVADFFTDIIDKAKKKGADFVTGLIDKVKELPSKIWDKFTLAISKVISFGTDLKDKAGEAGKKLVDGLIDKVKSLPGDIMDIGSDVVEGLWNGISNMSEWIGKKIKGFGEDVLGGIKDFFGIHSPSRVMRDQVGKYLALGLAEGINKNKDAVTGAMDKIKADISTPINLDTSGKNHIYSAQGGTYGTNATGANRTSYVFNQYNNSPKALSRLEIYRQTKNQLNFAKGV